jgi:serine/threonine protein kinase/tetratricopeptide (TPR) repeat protein
MGLAVNDADQHLLTIFSTALERETAAARAAYLDAACAGEPDLRARVEALLRAHERPGPFLEPDATGPPAAGPRESDTAPYGGPFEGPGATIGPYRLLQVIGEGGMGTVYMAEQAEPVRRRVALKVVRAGLDGRQILARFEAERQALALMDHPNIARVLDAGATPDGRPYFAMELVKGVPITQFCDERRLPPRERIDLFVAVCQAVQHAHQKGVIHRDLKPSNVLVALYDDRPVPKVIDFGIAKATGTKLADQTIFTEFGAVIGTLEYMSPEQAQLNQLDVDTRSDVYSLGVLLYELLTGTTPIDRKALGRAAVLEVLRQVREAETPRPSQRLSTAAGLATIAAARGLDPGKLSGLVRGDLDWIVMKALEKDRSRRYETANALARDLQRHLAGEDVEACPPSASYRLRKFARRHRVALSVGATIAATLVVATAVSTWQAIRATRAERDAVEAAEIERLTSHFFIDNLLGNADIARQAMGEIAPDPDIKVRTLVDRAAARVDEELAGQPLLEAAVRRMIGRVYTVIGLPEAAKPFLERADAIHREQLGEEHPSTLRTAAELAVVEADLHQFDRAVARLRRVQAIVARTQGEASQQAVVTLANLAKVVDAADRHDEAVALSRRALDLAARSPELHRSQRAVLQNNLGLALLGVGDEAEAEAVLRDALSEAVADLGEGHPMAPLLRNNLSLLQNQSGRNAEAERSARAALDGARRLYGESHPYTLAAMQNLGVALREQNRLDEAEAILREKHRLAADAHGPDSLPAVYGATELAVVLRRRGRPAEAEAMLRDQVEPARRLGPGREAEVIGNLGMAIEELGRYPEAEQMLRRAESLYARLPTPGKRFSCELKRSLAGVLSRTGRHDEALIRSREAVALAEEAFGRDDRTTLGALVGLAEECRHTGRFDEAEAIYARCTALGGRLLVPDDHDLLTIRQNAAALLHVLGRFEAAEAQYRAALDGFSRTEGADSSPAITVLSNLGEMERDRGRPEAAEPMLREALAGSERLRGPEHPRTLWTLWKLAELERDRGRPDVAEPMFRRCLAGYAKAQGEDGLELAMLRADLAMNHLEKGEPGAAEPLLREALRAYETQLPDDWRRFEILGQLGEALALQGKYDEAEPLVLSGFEGLQARRDRVTVDAWARRPEAGRRVVRLYESWGKPDQAEAWRQKLSAGAPRSPEAEAPSPKQADR